MATVLICVKCKHPMTFRDSAPVIGKDWEHEVTCKSCNAQYAIVVRLTVAPVIINAVNVPS